MPFSAGVKTWDVAPYLSPCGCGKLNSIAKGFSVPSSSNKRRVLVAYVFVAVVFMRLRYGINVS